MTAAKAGLSHFLPLTHTHTFTNTHVGQRCGRQEDETVSEMRGEGGAALLFPVSEEEH